MRTLFPGICSCSWSPSCFLFLFLFFFSGWGVVGIHFWLASWRWFDARFFSDLSEVFVVTGVLLQDMVDKIQIWTLCFLAFFDLTAKLFKFCCLTSFWTFTATFSWKLFFGLHFIVWIADLSMKDSELEISCCFPCSVKLFFDAYHGLLVSAALN